MEAAGVAETQTAPSEAAAEAHSAPETDHGTRDPVTSVAAETGDDERDDQGRYLSREAIRYRRALRDTEAERD